MRLLEQQIHQGQQGQEGNQHRRHVQGQPQAVGRASGRRPQYVRLLSLDFQAHHARGHRDLRFRHNHLGQIDGGRSGHGHRGQHVLGADPGADVGAQDGPRHRGHACGHHRHQLGLGELVQVGSDGERRLGLAHEDRGRGVQRLGPARAHQAGHHLGQRPDDGLHDAVVIENGEERRDEDDGGQHLEGEVEGILRGGLRSQLPEQEPRTFFGKSQQAVHSPGEERDGFPAEGCLQHQYRQAELQPEAPKDGSQPDGPPVGGEQHGDSEHDQ